jgi:hypothetical protein
VKLSLSGIRSGLRPHSLPFASLRLLPFVRCVGASLWLAVAAGGADAASLPPAGAMGTLARTAVEKWSDAEGSAVQRADAKAMMVHATSSLTAKAIENRVWFGYDKKGAEAGGVVGSNMVFFHTKTWASYWLADLPAYLMLSLGVPRGFGCLVSLKAESDTGFTTEDESFEEDESPAFRASVRRALEQMVMLHEASHCEFHALNLYRGHELLVATSRFERVASVAAAVAAKAAVVLRNEAMAPIETLLGERFADERAQLILARLWVVNGGERAVYEAAMQRYLTFRMLEDSVASQQHDFNDHDTWQVLEMTLDAVAQAADTGKLPELVGRTDADDAMLTEKALRIVLDSLEAGAERTALRFRDSREFERQAKDRSAIEAYRSGQSLAEGIR